MEIAIVVGVLLALLAGVTLGPRSKGRKDNKSEN
ncbi:hypothetical protein IWX75_003118 [Arthrobacter sp. CAN_A6]